MFASLKMLANLESTPSHVTIRVVTAFVAAGFALTATLSTPAAALPYKPGVDTCDKYPDCLFAK
jgi:hypothetical protein